jgi:hypothetical protein
MDLEFEISAGAISFAGHRAPFDRFGVEQAVPRKLGDCDFRSILSIDDLPLQHSWASSPKYLLIRPALNFELCSLTDRRSAACTNLAQWL